MTARQKAEDRRTLSIEGFHDPYDAMSDEEFSSYIGRLFGEVVGPTRSITIRMPEDLLIRIQRIASGRRIPYQRLMKRMLEESVSGLERRAALMKQTATRGTRTPSARPKAGRS